MKHVIGRLLTFYTRDMSHFIIGVAINCIQILMTTLAITGYEGLEPQARVLIATISTFLQVLYNVRNYLLADNSIKGVPKEVPCSVFWN